MRIACGIGVVLASCAAPAPRVRPVTATQAAAVPPAAPISCSSEQPDGLYPPRLVQLCAQQRDALADALRAHSPVHVDRVRVSSLGDIELYTSDRALVADPPHGGALRPEEIAGLRPWVAATADTLHVHGEPRVTPTQFVELADKQPDRVTTIAATRISDRVFELTVKTQLVIAVPDPDRAKPLRDRLVNARYTRVAELRAHPCDPSGPVDNCPRDSRVERTLLQLAASQITTGVGMIELVRGRGAPKEAHAIGCADLSIQEPEQAADPRADYLPGPIRYEPIGDAPRLPLVIDLVTGEDLTALLHANGWVDCVRGVAQGAAVAPGDIDLAP